MFQPYGRRRGRGRPPRWLVLLVFGALLGAGGVLLVQWRYLPPRLSAAESTALRSDFEQAEAQRAKLQVELGETAKQLRAALAGTGELTDELAASRATTGRLRDDIAATVAALPPDPRGGTVEVRAGRFVVGRGNALGYELVLTRERLGAKPLEGVVQLVVGGATARGVESSFTSPAAPVAIGAHAVVRGSVALPEGFRPKQATVQVLDRAGGRSLGMRVLLVK